MAARSENLQPLQGQPAPSGLQGHCVTDAHFPGAKNRRIDARALFVPLGNAARNCGARLCARRIERDHHATLVDLRDGDPRCVSHTKNPADPVQLIEGFATFQIDEQVRTKPQGVFFSVAFLRDPRYRLAADERDGRDIVRAAIVVQQEELSARVRLECLAEFVALNGELLPTRGGDRHLDFPAFITVPSAGVPKSRPCAR